ncbi:MAG: hypothetical protein AVDCRST_MAG68-5041, partial [uncultured Gemmatimonadetes bacterium]
ARLRRAAAAALGVQGRGVRRRGRCARTARRRRRQRHVLAAVVRDGRLDLRAGTPRGRHRDPDVAARRADRRQQREGQGPEGPSAAPPQDCSGSHRGDPVQAETQQPARPARPARGTPPARL